MFITYLLAPSTEWLCIESRIEVENGRSTCSCADGSCFLSCVARLACTSVIVRYSMRREITHVFRNMARNCRRGESRPMARDRWSSLFDFCRRASAAFRCMPASKNIRSAAISARMENYHAKVAELAEIGVDLIHPEGGPPFMVRGHKAEQEIVSDWEAKYKVPIFTSGMSQAEALRALGIKKFVGCTYFHDRRSTCLRSLLQRRRFRGAGHGRHGYVAVRSRQNFQRHDLPASQIIVQQTSDGARYLPARLRAPGR